MNPRRNLPIIYGLLFVMISGLVLFAGAGNSFARRADADCDAYARDYADRHSGGGGDVLGGALGGAATGAILGGIIGGGRGAGTGAAIGGGVGALGGGSAAASNWNYVYNRAYDRCMRE